MGLSFFPWPHPFYSDHPFAILQGSWMTPAKKAAAQAFRNFLLDKPQQLKALQYVFRPSDPSIAIGAPIDSAHGVDPGQPQTLLQIPSADVVRSIKAAWNVERRKVDVMLILDRSGSMDDLIGGTSKLQAAKQGLKQFITLLSDSDSVGLTVFGDAADVVSPVSQLGAKRQDLLTRVDNIVSDGATRLFDTINEQVQALQSQSTPDIKAVVVLTDGIDNRSTLKIDQLVAAISASGENAGNAVKVFTIAYGGNADASGLTKIASATGGQEYTGTPQNIQQVFVQISEFF
jgi:Ca-activated chloride channel homolog